jgi:hypothetical protein
MKKLQDRDHPSDRKVEEIEQMITKQAIEAAELARARANFTDENIEVFAHALAGFIAGWAPKMTTPIQP